MRRYRISPIARADIKEIYRFVANDKPAAAGHLRAIFYEKFRLLAAQPLMGEVCDELAENLRRSFVGNYVIYYRPSGHGIDVVRVLHGARDVDALF